MFELVVAAEAVDLGAYSRASGIRFTRELEAVRAEAEQADADRDALSKRLLDAWSLLEEPPDGTAAVDRSWVTASTVSWDGRRDAAVNGWAMFDGDPATFADTKQSSGWVRVLPTGPTAFTVDTVRFLPRSGYADRAYGFQFQGSDDGGQTWQTVATITEIEPAGWTEIALHEAVDCGAVRVYAPSGFTNLAEVELVHTPVDATGLDLYLAETESLSESDWSAESWVSLADARETALALRAEGADPTQEEVDATVDALAAAVEGLEPVA
jgi:hypothetical protein